MSTVVHQPCPSCGGLATAVGTCATCQGRGKVSRLMGFADVRVLPGGAERLDRLADEDLLRESIKQDLLERQERDATPEERAFAVRELMASQAGAIFAELYLRGTAVEAVAAWLALSSKMQNFIETGRFEEPTVPDDGEDE